MQHYQPAKRLPRSPRSDSPDALAGDGVRSARGLSHPILRAECGFTIIELIIVIVVIAILATVVAVSSNGFIDRAAEVSLKSDLRNGATLLDSNHAFDKHYPDSAADADGGRGLPESKGNTIGYYKTATSYCLEAASERSNVKRFHIAGTNPNKILDGPCVMQVSVLAGTSEAGNADGGGEAARFFRPHGVAVDRLGNVYVADESNHSIRKVTPSGVTTTLAGTGVRGFADGPGTIAQFTFPHSVAVDNDGYVYVAEGSHLRRPVLQH